jgi:hypothetical protein
MPADIQLTFPELDFVGRSVVTIQEIAAKWSCSPTNVWNQRVIDPHHLVEEGRIPVLNIGTVGLSRPSLRVPVSGYRIATAARLTGPAAVELLRAMPRDQRIALIEDLRRSLAA